MQNLTFAIHTLIGTVLIFTREREPDHTKRAGGTHIKMTCYFEGEETTLNPIAESVWGRFVDKAKKAFN